MKNRKKINTKNTTNEHKNIFHEKGNKFLNVISNHYYMVYLHIHATTTNNHQEKRKIN